MPTLFIQEYFLFKSIERKKNGHSMTCRQILGGFESNRYLRLKFDLNERFKAKANETYKDTRALMKAQERTNGFTGKKSAKPSMMLEMRLSPICSKQQQPLLSKVVPIIPETVTDFQ